MPQRGEFQSSPTFTSPLSALTYGNHDQPEQDDKSFSHTSHSPDTLDIARSIQSGKHSE
jgi:hypothetical protein